MLTLVFIFVYSHFTFFFNLNASIAGFFFDDKVCFKNLGCFKKNDPFDNALGELPSSPADINARAFLWTRTNSKTPQELIYSNLTSINSSNFDASKKTYICIHGYMSSKSTPIIANMSVALLKKVNTPKGIH